MRKDSVEFEDVRSSICYGKNSATVLAKKLAKISQPERLLETFTEATEDATI